METAIGRRKRSEKLTTEEWDRFKEFVKTFDTQIDCAERLKISRVTLNMVLVKGSGKPETIAVIREALNEA